MAKYKMLLVAYQEVEVESETSLEEAIEKALDEGINLSSAVLKCESIEKLD